jgi:hypothetical protein
VCYNATAKPNLASVCTMGLAAKQSSSYAYIRRLAAILVLVTAAQHQRAPTISDIQTCHSDDVVRSMHNYVLTCCAA